MTSTFSSLDPAKRESILNAAFKEFAQKGFEDASTNTIVQGAGISKGLLFHYFNTKKELFLALFDYGLMILQTQILDRTDLEERDVFIRFRQAIRLKMDLIHAHPYIFDFIVTAAMTESEQVKAELDVKQNEMRGLTQSTVFENIDTTKFKSGLDVKRALKILIWTSEGYERAARQQIRETSIKQVNYDAMMVDFDAYLDMLQSCFYEEIGSKSQSVLTDTDHPGDQTHSHTLWYTLKN